MIDSASWCRDRLNEPRFFVDAENEILLGRLSGA